MENKGAHKYGEPPDLNKNPAMKLRKKIIIISFFAAIAFWLFDMVVDYFVFPLEPVISSRIANAMAHEIYMRTLGSGIIFLSGLVFSFILSRRAQIMTDLRTAEAFNKSIMSNSPYASVAIRPDTSIEYVNPAFEEISGYSLEEVRGLKPPYPWWLRDRAEQAEVLLVEMMNNPASGLEVTARRKNGEIFWAEVTNTQILENGELKYLLGTWVDVTQRKKYEYQLKESEEKYRTLHDSMEQGVIYMDRGGNIISMNPAAERILGIQHGSLKTLTDVKSNLKIVHEDGTAYAMEEYPALVSLKTGKAVKNVVIGIHIPETEDYRWVNVNSMPRFRPGEEEPYQVFVTFEDITERKQARDEIQKREQNFRAAFDISPLATFINRGRGEVIYANQAALELCGYKNLEEFKNASFEDRHTPEYIEIIKRRWDNWEKGIPADNTQGEVTILKRPDGEIRHIVGFSNQITWDGELVNQVIFHDITAVKQAEDALKESEEFNSSLLENNPNPMAVINPDASLGYVNPAFLELTGFSGDEIANIKPPYPWWPEKIIPSATEKIRRELNGEWQHFEAKLKKKTGEYFWVDITTTPVMGEEGTKYLLATWVDITDRKQAEMALIKSEKNLRKYSEELSAIFNTSSDAMKLIDKDYNILRVNPAMAALDGMSDQSAIGKKCYEVAKSNRCHTKNCMLDLVRETKRRMVYESEVTHLDGSKLTCIVTITPILDENGELTGLLEDFVDITERKRIEEELKDYSESEAQLAREWQSLFDASMDISTLISPDYEFLRVNKATCLTLGKKPEEIIGKKCYELVHGLDRPIEGCPCQSLMETNQACVSEIKDGDRYYIASASPVWNDEGEMVAFAHTVHDITERKQMEEQLRHSQVLASLGEMTAGIAHEVGNPLASIVLYSELAMKNSELSSETRDDLGVIHSEAQRAGKLMKDLLAYSRKLKPKKKQIDVNGIINNVLDLRNYQQRVQNISATRSAPDEALYINGDEPQLTQVFINLILNAEEAISANGGGNIHIKCETTGGWARIEIADDGPGIPEENLEQIFLPFVTTKDIGKGTGLGLSTCYGIITAHNGLIDAKNNEYGGATFTVCLPLSEQPSETLQPVNQA